VKHAPEPPDCTPKAAALTTFVNLLLDWNQRINLVVRADEAEIWARHVEDSAQLSQLLPADAQEIIDLGSGAGFPGLILAITTSRHVHLVESDARKASFLRHAVRETGANASVHAIRAESLRLPLVPVVTSRAFAPLVRLLPLAAPLLAPDGVCILPKGRSVAQELTEAHHEWQMQVERFPSRTSPDGTLLRLREICRVPSTG